MTDVACSTSLLAKKGWRLPTFEPHDQHLDKNDSAHEETRTLLKPKSTISKVRRPPQVDNHSFTKSRNMSTPILTFVTRTKHRSKSRQLPEDFRIREVLPETVLTRLERMVKRLTEPGRGFVDTTMTTNMFEDITLSENGPGTSKKDNSFHFFFAQAKKLIKSVNGFIVCEEQASLPSIDQRRMFLLLTKIGFVFGVRVDPFDSRNMGNMNNNRQHVPVFDIAADVIQDKLKYLRQSGYDFVICKYMFKVGECLPPHDSTPVHGMCSLAAGFAQAAQKNGLVPIVSVALESKMAPVQADDLLRLEAFENIMKVLITEMNAHGVLIEFLIIKFQTPANHKGHVELNVGAFGPATNDVVNPWKTLNTDSSRVVQESKPKDRAMSSDIISCDNKLKKPGRSHQAYSQYKRNSITNDSNRRDEPLWGDLKNDPEPYDDTVEACLAQDCEDRSNLNSIIDPRSKRLQYTECDYYNKISYLGSSRPVVMQPGQVKIMTLRAHRVFTTATAIMRSIPPIIGGLLLSEEDSLDVSLALLAEFNKMPVNRWTFHVGFSFGRVLEEGVIAKFTEMSVWPPKHLTPVTLNDKLEMAGDLFSRNLKMCGDATLGAKGSLNKSWWFQGSTFT